MAETVSLAFITPVVSLSNNISVVLERDGLIAN